MSQLDSETISALRAVLEEVCGHLPLSSTTTRTVVASKILEQARGGDQRLDELRKAGLDALKSAPSMWR
jgi:hypothetical protein